MEIIEYIMYLFGASGHAKVVLDILRRSGVEVTALVDDNEAITTLSGHSVLHRRYDLSPLIICVGDNRLRRSISQRLSGEFVRAIDPTATVSESVTIGDGTVVMQGAIIQADAVVGEHVIVNTGASIDHDCRVGDYVHISPHATLCGGVSIGEGSWVGAGATIIQGVDIGRWVTIGAGAVVVSSIPDGAVVVGVPAKIIKYSDCYE